MSNVSDSSKIHFTRSKKINRAEIKFLSSIENKNSKKLAHKFLEETYRSVIKFTKKRNKSKNNFTSKTVYSPVPFPKKSKSNKNIKKNEKTENDIDTVFNILIYPFYLYKENINFFNLYRNIKINL